MNSIERAPEPTMEEILSSIRRIISDDESSSVNQRTPSADQQAVENVASSEDEEADKRIIDDIARRLGGGEPGAGDDEVLDLTEAEPPVEELAAERAVVGEAVVEVVTATVVTGQGEAAEPDTATAHAASAIEQAIAALKGGGMPSATPQAAPAPAPEAQSAPEPEIEPEIEPEPVVEADLVLTEVEMVAAPEEEPAESMAAAEDTAEPEGADEAFELEPAATEPAAPEPEKPSFFAGVLAKSESGTSEPAQSGGHINGGGAANGLQSSLEANVKGVLRPVLRKWLDENMTRVLAAALRDDLKGSDEHMALLLTSALYDELADVEAFRQRDDGDTGSWSH